MAIASMVFGILSITSGNLIFAILAMIFSSKATSDNDNPQFAKIGKITGIIGLVTSILAILAVVIIYVIYFAVIIGAAATGGF